MRSLLAFALLAIGCTSPSPGLDEAIHFYPTVNEQIIEARCNRCHIGGVTSPRFIDFDDGTGENYASIVRLPATRLMIALQSSPHLGDVAIPDLTTWEAWIADGEQR
jgi:hypothetical protein